MKHTIIASNEKEIWAIHDDGLQWVICKRHGKAGKMKWNPIAYITTKFLISRFLGERGVIISRAGHEFIRTLPIKYRIKKAGNA